MGIVSCSMMTEKISSLQISFGVGPHMGRGGGGGKGGECTPLRVKNNSPPLYQKNGYPSQKILDLFYFIPPFLAFFYCACLFFHQTEKLQQRA